MLNERNQIIKEHIESLTENPVGHVFNRNIGDNYKKDDIVAEIIKIQATIQKLRKLLMGKERENQVLKKEYQNTKGKWQKVKDYFRRVGQYSNN